MIYRNTRQQIEEYYALDRLNQSSITTILEKGIQFFLDNEQELKRQEESTVPEKEKPHFIIGGGVDVSITHHPEDFDQIYHTSKLKKKPSDGPMEVLKRLFEILSVKSPISRNLSDYQHEIIDVCNEVGYSMKYGVDARMDAITKRTNGIEYWEDLVDAVGKQILSEEEGCKIETITYNFLNHPFTKHLFISGPNVDIVYQFITLWEEMEVPCKAMIDMIRIDHENKRIIPIDLKTTGEYILGFKNAVRKRRYDLQGAFYTRGISMNLVKLQEIIGRSLSGYSIANFAFIVESTKKSGVPIIFPLSNDLLTVGENGDARYLSGWRQGVSIYKEWKDVDFDIGRRLAAINGVIWLDFDFDYSINYGG